MNKNRFEAFIDAVIAIIITIMVLEIKAPTTNIISWAQENWSYLFAYIVSFAELAAYWYNNNRIFQVTEQLSAKTYWISIIWLFEISLLPILTSWVGANAFNVTAEYSYFIINLINAITWIIQIRSIDKDAKIADPNYEKDKFIIQQEPMRFVFLVHGIALILIYWIPLLGLITILISVIFVIIQTILFDDFGKTK